jgi:hypothetical protein
MLARQGQFEWSLAWARKAVVHNFVKEKTRGTWRVAQRLIERGQVSHEEGVADSQLTAWEDEQWVAEPVRYGVPEHAGSFRHDGR